MINGIHHSSFIVSNLREAERFFTELLGMQRVGGGTYDFEYIRKTVGVPNAILNIAILAYPSKAVEANTHQLELMEYAQGGGPPLSMATNCPGGAHICFDVDDIHAEYNRLTAQGVRFRSKPNEVTWGLNLGAWSVYFTGPDGIALEMIQRPRHRA